MLSDRRAGSRWAWERWARLSSEASPLAGTNPADPLPNIRTHVPRRAHYVAKSEALRGWEKSRAMGGAAVEDVEKREDGSGRRVRTDEYTYEFKQGASQ